MNRVTDYFLDGLVLQMYLLKPSAPRNVKFCALMCHFTGAFHSHEKSHFFFDYWHCTLGGNHCLRVPDIPESLYRRIRIPLFNGFWLVQY